MKPSSSSRRCCLRCSTRSATPASASIVLADRGDGLERWYANEARRRDARLHARRELERSRRSTSIVPEQRAARAAARRRAFRAGQPVPPALELDRAPQGRQPARRRARDRARPRPRRRRLRRWSMRDIGAHQQTQLSLLEADRIGLVGALAAGFAHEINNPLTSVLLNLRSLRKQLAAHARARAGAGAALPRRHHDRRRADREQRARAADARDAQRDPADRPRGGGVVRAPPRGADARAARPRDPPDLPGPRRSPARSRASARPCSRCCCSRARASTPSRHDSSNRIVVAVEERAGRRRRRGLRQRPRPDRRRGARARSTRSSARRRAARASASGSASRARSRPRSAARSRSRPRAGGGAVITMRLPAAERSPTRASRGRSRARSRPARCDRPATPRSARS